MSARLNFYFRQKVTEAELDLGFTMLEAADRAMMYDQAQTGVLAGGTVTQRAGGANTSVDVAGLVAYDKLGQRIQFGASQNLDLTVDENDTSTAVSGIGNSKIVSVYVRFKRILSDQRIDGNSIQVYFQETESYEFVVRQGAESNVPAPPPLDPTYILLADITRTYGVAAIVNGAIGITRREDVFVAAGTPRSIRQGRVSGALAELLGHYNNHVNGALDKHPATAITYGGSGTWADGTAGLAAGTAESGLDEVVTDLASTGGSGFVGAPAYSPGNSVFSLSAGTVRSQLQAIAQNMDRPQVLPVTAVNANLVLAANDGKTVLKVSAAANLNITLPPAASAAGRRIYIKDANGTFGTYTVTLVRNGAELIEGIAGNRQLFAAGGSYCFWCDGTNWFMDN